LPTPAASTPPAFATVSPRQLDALAPPQTRGIGQLTGDWIFVLGRSTLFGSLPYSPGAEQIVATNGAADTLTLVPVAGPETRAVAVATFLSDLGGGIAATNLVGAQLSPDGSRVVLSVGTRGPQGGERLGLVIIELASGAMFNLTTDPTYHDDTAAWSPDGKQIAFTRRSVRDGGDAGIWAVAARPGSAVRGPFLRPVNVVGRRSLVYGWAPDGVWLAISRGNDRYEYVNVPPESCPNPGVCAGGNVADMLGDVYEGRDIADWRRAVPQFVGVFVESPRGGVQSIQVADGPTTERRVVVRGAQANVLLQRPRWRPGSNEFLYLETQIATGPRTVRLKIVDARTGAQREVLSRDAPFWAEWTPAGDAITLVETNGVAVRVRVVSTDGSGERTIYGTGGIPEAQVITVDFGTLRF
jgi:dipeptidyl aminopeptidase/acylaminoacyl peptidase